MREQTEAMRLPRFLWVPFELGRPFGAPNEPDFQRRVLREALGLLERDDGPVVLADFPHEAPISDEETVWACPVSFAPAPLEHPDLVTETLAEMGRLTPWMEGAREIPANSGMTRDEMVAFLGGVAAGDAQVADVDTIRLAADDLRTWYLRAASRQPGRATTQELQTWFWRQTALARVLGAIAARLRDDPDPMTREFARRAVVPRDHMAVLVPEPLVPDPGAHDE